MSRGNFQAQYASSILVTRSQETPANSGVCAERESERSASRSALDRFVGGHATKTMLVASVLVIIGLLIHALPAHGTASGPKRGTPAYCRAHAVNEYAARVCTVRVMWPASQREKALRVADCESGFNPNAHNGQYLGVWQMSADNRRKYGHPPTVEGQTRVAIKLQAAEGWSQWECS